MGAIAWTLITGLVAGFSAAAPWIVYANRVVPALERKSARRAAYYVAAVPAVIASALQLAHAIGFSTGSVRDDVILIAATVGLACSWGPIAHGATSITGGPTALRDQVETQAIGVHASSHVRGARTVASTLGIGLFIVTMTTFTVPAVASIRACLDTERILADAEPPPANTNPIDIAFSHNPPEPGAQFLIDFPMSLDLAADGKSDPQTRAQLAAAGFTDAYARSWVAQDGNGIQVEIIEFATEAGADTYHGQVNRYACGYADQAFAAPMGGVGLQVRYQSGAPFVEQISWVAGNRRYMVMVSEYERPSNHSRILLIQETSAKHWPTARAPADEEHAAPATPGASVGEDAMDELRAAVDATIAEGSVFINKRIGSEGSTDIPEDATWFNGLVSLEHPRETQGVLELVSRITLGASSMEVIQDDTSVYLRGEIVGPVIGDGRWVTFDVASDHPRASEYQALVSGYNHPSIAVFYLYGVTRVLGVSDDVVHELPARRYTVEIDLEAALDAVPRSHADTFRATLATLKSAGIETDLKAEIWVTLDGMVHHIDYRQGLEAETGEGLMITSVDMFDFGVPVNADIPGPELVTRVEDVKGPTEPLPRT
jgi:hypothetical protein